MKGKRCIYFPLCYAWMHNRCTTPTFISLKIRYEPLWHSLSSFLLHARHCSTRLQSTFKFVHFGFFDGCYCFVNVSSSSLIQFNPGHPISNVCSEGLLKFVVLSLLIKNKCTPLYYVCIKFIYKPAALWRLNAHCFTAPVINVVYDSLLLYYGQMRANCAPPKIFHGKNHATELRLQLESFAICYCPLLFHEETRFTAIYLQ